MPTPQHTISRLHPAKIGGKHEVAKNTFQVDLDLEAGFEFNPGQYIWLILPKLLHEDVRGGGRRAFSIVSSPSEKNRISIVFRNSTSGYKKTLLELQEGSEVAILGPCGTLSLPEKDTQPAVMIAGGVGIAPFMSMIRAATEAHSHQPLTLLCANTESGREIYRTELADLRSKNPTLSVSWHIGVPSFDTIAAAVKDISRARYYVIGPQGMVDAIASSLVAHGVAVPQLFFEENYFHFGSYELPLLTANIEIFKMAVESSTNHIIITDIDGKIVFANKGAENIVQFTQEEMIGQTPRLWGGLMSGEFYSALWRTIKTERRSFTGEIKNRRKNGEEYYAITHISPVIDAHDTLIGFVGTEEDITKRVELDRARSEFVSLASHQLRTPLSAVKWTLELFKKDAGLSQKHKERLNDLYVSNQRLIDIVNNLLDISRRESGTRPVDKKTVSIVDRINASVKDMQPSADRKRQRITVSVGDGIKETNLDPILFDEAFNNLLSNAISYAPDGTPIGVTVGITGAMYVISVSNTGRIAKADQEKLFTRFYRGEDARKARPEGSGLGLYIAKSAVEGNGGRLWLESSNETGTVFHFTVPME